MVGDGVQISKDTHCSNCGYLVIANSEMHVMDGKYYCASCADGKRKGAKE